MVCDIMYGYHAVTGSVLLWDYAYGYKTVENNKYRQNKMAFGLIVLRF